MRNLIDILENIQDQQGKTEVLDFGYELSLEFDITPDQVGELYSQALNSGKSNEYNLGGGFVIQFVNRDGKVVVGITHISDKIQRYTEVTRQGASDIWNYIESK